MIAAKAKNRPQHEQPRPHPAAGFTLIEVMLALAVFSVGLMATASMQVSSVNKNNSSRMNTMAVEYASEYMERLLGLGMDSEILDNDVDDDGINGVDDPGEVLSYPHLAAGGPYRPADFIGTDWDGDGAVDVPVNPEFDALFDLTWTVTDGTSDSSSIGTGASVEGPVKLISLSVTFGAGSGETITLSSIKATAL